VSRRAAEALRADELPGGALRRTTCRGRRKPDELWGRRELHELPEAP
jgi:hypothetical protein